MKRCWNAAGGFTAQRAAAGVAIGGDDKRRNDRHHGISRVQGSG